MRYARIQIYCLLVAAALATAGCARGVDATPSYSKGQSVNGTGALAELFRLAGHEVRSAFRLDDKLKANAETIVRFAPAPGRPDRDEAAWYADWLKAGARRRLVYVPLDFNAESEYWAAALDRLPAGATEETRERMKRRRQATQVWPLELPKRAEKPADPEEWFETKNESTASICERLSGPWAEGVGAKDAAITRHETLTEDGTFTLLAGDGLPLVIEWGWPGTDGRTGDGGRTLVVANGSFLLNEPLARPARRPLALRVVDWAGGERRRQVTFVEGRHTLGGPSGPPSPFDLAKTEPYRTISIHFVVLALVGCLSLASVLGRPRPEPPSGSDRPAAHAEALGALLAKSRDVAAARSVLDAYRRWRCPGAQPSKAREHRVS